MRLLVPVSALLVLAAHPAVAQSIAVRVTRDPSTITQQEKLAAPIEQCIRDGAAKTEQAVPDLNDAVVFLVDKLCAQPIADENNRRTRLAAEEAQKNWQAACNKAKAQAKNGQSAQATAACMMASETHIGFTGIDQFNASTIPGPPAAVALASQLLLDLRLANM